MDSQQPSPPVKKILVKRVKVLVKRPVSAPSQAAPVPQQPAVVKVPVRTVAAPVQKPRSESRPSAARPFIFEMPDDLVAFIRKADNIFLKMLLFYVYARIYAEQSAKRNGYKIPKLRLPLPRDTAQIPQFADKFKKKKPSSFIKDIMDIAPFINGLERIIKTNAPTEKIVQAELQRIGNRTPSTADQIILAYLDIRLDMEIITSKIKLRAAKEEAKLIIETVKEIKKVDDNIKKRFITAIERKKFPVDAKKLIDNYFTLAKKEPEKAYQTLITNPLFFSPILIEKMPKKTSAEKAAAVNKQLASFLKGLKV